MITRALALVLAIAAPGCGVILGYGEPQPLDVTTTPPGATLYVNEAVQSQVSPCRLELDPTRSYFVRAKLGELKAASQVKKTLRFGVAVADACLTLGIGLLVDTLTGALYAFDPALSLGLAAPIVVDSSLAPCGYCGEPRGAKDVCPHCGMR